MFVRPPTPFDHVPMPIPLPFVPLFVDDDIPALRPSSFVPPSLCLLPHYVCDRPHADSSSSSPASVVRHPPVADSSPPSPCPYYHCPDPHFHLDDFPTPIPPMLLDIILGLVLVNGSRSRGDIPHITCPFVPPSYWSISREGSLLRDNTCVLPNATGRHQGVAFHLIFDRYISSA